MVTIGELQEYCMDLLNTDKRIRQGSASALEGLGREVIPVLEKIIVSQHSLDQKNWPLLVGAVSTLNLHGISQDHMVAEYQRDLIWLPEDQGRYDLHVHTNLSDGTQTVEEVVNGAISSCTKVISLCDHNTMGGVLLAQELGARYGIRVLPGCEFSTHMDVGGRNPEWIEVHIAGYFLNPSSAEVQDLFMYTQRRIQLRDILIANDFLVETEREFRGQFGHGKGILDIIVEANRHYATILRKNGIHDKAAYVDSTMDEVEKDRSIEPRLQKLIHNAARSSLFYDYSREEESLLRRLILFSGYMIDHAMNIYYDQMTGREFTGGNWFSEIKKRQEKYVHCLPKIDPAFVVEGIHNLGGVAVLSHPTWYTVLSLQKARRKLHEQGEGRPTDAEETQFREDALRKGFDVARRMHEIMPNGLQIMELYHWSYDVEFDLEPHYKKLARELGASLSTASDFHGPKKYGEHRSRIGTGVEHNILGTYEQVQALERLRKDVK
jgi:predicted metal-dependent phosphoesterase TrpH